MVFVVGDLGAWLVFILAEAGRKKLTSLVLGGEQERALRSAATAAVQRTAAELRPANAEQLVMVVREVFRTPVPGAPLAGQATVLEALQAGIDGQLASLDDPDLTGTGKSSAEVLGVPARTLALELTSHLVQEIRIRGARGGPLAPLADQLNHDATHLQLERLPGRLAEELREALAWQPKMLVPPEPGTEEWVVDRPAEASAVVAALVGGGANTVGITTGLHGAGGFGKTTLARMVTADLRVRQQFSGYVHWVTVGRDVRREALAAKVNDVIKVVADEDATYTDPEQAGQRLGALLDIGPPRMLVLDDVWEPEQLAPFAAGGRHCARLVTTRVPGLLGGWGVLVPVDQMSPEQARKLLTSGLAPLDPVLINGLLAVTGRWPLLLRLANKILVNAAQAGADVPAAGAQLLAELRAGGPTVVDDLSGKASDALDVRRPEERARAVRATIEASSGLLNPGDALRFAELGAFAEDEAIPFDLIARFWRLTGGLNELQASQVCARFGELALVSPTGLGSGGVAVHDVIRAFLRGELGPERLADLNGVLLDAVATGLPVADPLGAASTGPPQVAWWELGRRDRYMRDHLIEHLLDAGRGSDAEGVAGDLRWMGVRLEESGPAAPAADLALLDTPRAVHMGVVLAQTAHLLAPTEPAGAVVDVLHSRVAGDPDWGPQVIALRDICHRPRLVNRWPLPDLPDSALRRVLTGHAGWVTAVAVAPDGSWLATASYDGTARIWDSATGRERAVLVGHSGPVQAVAVAPDGSWLATGGDDATARIWDAASGRERATLSGHASTVAGVAVAPDGSWLATASYDGTARIWDVATGRERAALTGHNDWVHAVAVAPDGSWLATGSRDGTARIWDTATGQEWATLVGHVIAVMAVAVAPDGSWLATGSGDETVRIWDAATGRERAALTGHNDWVHAVAVAPDGSWLATGGQDETARIWDAATRQERATLTGHASTVTAVAVASDGSWLVTGSLDNTARIWDAATGRERATLTGHNDWVRAVAVAPDGSWLATGGYDGTARIWDAATGQERATLAGHADGVAAVAVAPDGSWLATGGYDRTARISDAATGQERAVLVGHALAVLALAVAPDGSWLATASGDLTARIWDPATGQEQAVLVGHTGPVHAVAVAPDGGWLATSGDDATARIWDPATGQERATLTGHAGPVAALAVAPDGSWLATASNDQTARIWDPATGQERATLTGHVSAVTAVAVAPDGSWLATGGYDGTARIWDAATGQERATLTGHAGPVAALAVAPYGSWLATVSHDATVRIWDPATGRARALMRVENALYASAWTDNEGLAVGSRAGLYVFDLLSSAVPPSVKR
jgi:WD40 repeat protein